jgi:hypothetical protein
VRRHFGVDALHIAGMMALDEMWMDAQTMTSFHDFVDNLKAITSLIPR